MTQPASDTVVTAAELHQFIRRAFAALGMRDDDAALLADHLVWADLRGLAWLGARKVVQYVDQIRQGGASADAEPVVLQDRGAFTLIDAKHTLGQIATARAMRSAIEKARVFGVGVTSVRNTHSAGAMGYYPAMAAGEGMIGMAISNGTPLMTAAGGVEPVLGNQAFAVGSPAGRHDPVIVDMACSATSWVRIHEYEKRGVPIPEGLALTSDGQPTVDPAAALAGMLLPMAGHRGYALAVLWEILTGALSGGISFSGLSAAAANGPDLPSWESILCLAINPEFSIPSEEFGSRVDEMIDQLKASARAPGVEEITVPGERGHATAAARGKEGIPLPADLVEALTATAAGIGVPWI